MKVLITGTTQGIGKAIAELFLKENHTVIGIDRQSASITDDNYTHYQCDIRDYEKLPDITDVNILINNAGMFSFCDMVNTPVERVKRTITLHDITYTVLCQLFGKDMAERGGGYILNMSSFSVWMPFPGLALYSASKAYTKSFSVAFAKEMRYKNVWVTAVCPAGIATDLYGLTKKWQGIGLKLHALSSPAFCARRGLRSLWRKRMCIVPDWWCKAFIPICGALPRFALNWLRNFTMKWQK